MDRSIVLELRRKLHDEHVDRLRYAEPGLFHSLAAKLARFSQDYSEIVLKAKPALPDALNDRAQDNWEPLLAIAEIAGDEWLTLARSTAIKISGNIDQSKSIGVELLADIQVVIESKQSDRISTADLIAALCTDEEKPWATYNRGHAITPRQIANRLKEFGIMSGTIRFGTVTAKGYLFWIDGNNSSATFYIWYCLSLTTTSGKYQERSMSLLTDSLLIKSTIAPLNKSLAALV